MSEQLHPEEKITTIIFVRHGDTLQTETGKIYNDHSAPLTDKGTKQIGAVAGWIGREKPELLLSSRADRVRRSAEILAAELSLDTAIHPSLDEASPGLWEGRSYLDIKKTEPEQYRAWCADPIRNAPPEGESILQQFARVERDIAEIVEKHHGKHVLLVTHAGVIRCALVSALGMPIDNFWRISVPTGSVSKVDYTSNFATVHFMSVRL